MKRTTVLAYALPAAALVVAALVVAGCGGIGEIAGGEVEPNDWPGKTDEFVGDNGGDSKPWPGFLGVSGDDVVFSGEDDKRVPTPLRLRRPVDVDTVPEGNVNWYSTKINVTTGRYVCLVVPYTEGDPDLYVLYPFQKKVMLQIPRPSRRTTSGTNLPPDWVVWDVANSTPGQYQIGVVGDRADGALAPHIMYAIEVDASRKLVVDGPTRSNPWREPTLLSPGSNWFHFMAASGTQYTVTLTTTNHPLGDADIYVYGLNSNQFRGMSNTSNAVDAVTFTANVNGYHHIRVYGYEDSTYTIGVTT